MLFELNGDSAQTSSTASRAVAEGSNQRSVRSTIRITDIDIVIGTSSGSQFAHRKISSADLHQQLEQVEAGIART
jgi:hypothetical protein